MRQSLIDLIDKTILYQYALPNDDKKIDGINLSTHKDDCIDYTSDNDLVELIYNSILEYSYNEFELTEYEHASLFARALINKIKYKEWQDQSVKIKYGFYGEVLLYSILYHFYAAKPVISRGYFYNPLENSETKGYDSYHLIENDGEVELWFGEVKFRQTLMSGVKSAIDGLDKALSDNYLNENIYAIDNHRNNIAIEGSKLDEILESWRQNPLIKPIDEIKKHNIKLVYPVLIVYQDDEKDYDKKIRNAVKEVNDKFNGTSYALSIDYVLFFIFLPITQVKKIKEEVIQWIESQKPLLS